MKICLECRHFRSGHATDYCTHPQADRTLVRGVYPDCWAMRFGGACGREGKLWEAKPPKRTLWARLF